MTKDEAIKWLKVELSYIEEDVGHDKEILEAYDMAIEVLEQQQDWIPIKWHEITEEEREREGYPEEWITHLDCLMPDDGQEILITVKGSKGRRWVEKDTALIDDEHYLDSGYDWVDDAIAWMPLPEPYVPDTNVGEMSESEVEE